MKRIVFVLMAVAVLTSCKFDVTKTVTVKSNAEQPRFLKGFERIQLMGSLDVSMHRPIHSLLGCMLPRMLLTRWRQQ